MNEIQIQKCKSAGTSFLKYFGIIIGGIGLCITILGAFTNFEFVKEHPYRMGLILFIPTIIVSLILVIHKIIFIDFTSKSTLDLPKEIERYVQLLYKEKNYIDVVRLGSTISRFLWLSQNNKERIIIGKMVEDSASKIGRLEVQIATLIDDIGWTYAAIGEHKQATENITRGIEKAEQAGFFYFAAKGERHLAGIESEVGDKSKIMDHLTKAQDYTEKITDMSVKSEMEASLYLAKSEHFFKTNNFEAAEINANLAKSVFANDLKSIFTFRKHSFGATKIFRSKR